MFQTSIPTADGRFLAWFSERGLARLGFPQGRKHAWRTTVRLPSSILKWQRTTERALKRLLAGGRPPELPPLDLASATAFQTAVWSELRRIPPGETRSYAEIARAIGSPRAARAVGQACGANPIPVLIPCHRVLASGHRIGGYSGGLNWKKKLLEREGSLP
jgi:O-6-methylguanine DNA methyltransferase